MRRVAAFLCDSPENIERVYGASGRARIASLAHLLPGCHGRSQLGQISQAEALFSTWGMPALSPSELAQLPHLKAVFYAAGSVQSFARPFLERGIRVVSAAAANAGPVAEFCLAQVLLAGKRYLPAQAALKSRGPAAWREPEGAGNHGNTVALLGIGRVGRRLAELLKPFGFRLIAYDPFLGEEAAAGLGLERVGLEEAFARGQVVSNHLADLPATRGLLTAAHFTSMPKGACFLNTGRGATLDEAGLWEALKRRPDLSAVLDVTAEEPPPAGSPAYTLENVFLSPHLAGSLGVELGRMADLAIGQFGAWDAGRPLEHEVDLAMLERMA